METSGKAPRRGTGKKIFKFIRRFCFLLVETVLLLALALYCGMFVLVKGPSPSLRDLFVLSVRETSAAGFLAELYLSDEEIAQIEASVQADLADTDTSLISLPTEPENGDSQEATGPVADAWGLIDDDGDGIIIQEVKRDGYCGYMMVVLDPKRVVVGCIPEDFGYEGHTVAEMAEQLGAVAAVNGGGFEDPQGHGDGDTPNSMVVSYGEVYYAHKGNDHGFAGLDSNGILHVGDLDAQDVKERDIQHGVSFGPVLISNGEINPSLSSGVNPRTAIGQRSDGAILLLVIDGRQLISLGATYQDLAEVLFDYGAVNGCNLDGGSSSLMWLPGGYISNCASLVGVRPLPTTILVMPEGGADNG